MGSESTSRTGDHNTMSITMVLLIWSGMLRVLYTRKSLTRSYKDGESCKSV